ncbi:Gamma-tubulin complex component 3 [Amphibalanus amphitrite]|uniref:Gamma-tubulin complex component 3 n=1 Tax=Amphibalanus amphitrite TaxID=1232801 RepID=A0A6A4WDP1_AMPAM|nr:Gamma-tubulin complex component 3 [Amphibalanus amphitrite]
MSCLPIFTINAYQRVSPKMQNFPIDDVSATGLLHKLCSRITRKKGDDVLPFFHRALLQLSSADGVAKKEYNMFIIGEQIKKLLAKNGRERDAVAFGDLFRRLQHSRVLKSQASVLCFLLHLSRLETDHAEPAVFQRLTPVTSLPAVARSARSEARHTSAATSGFVSSSDLTSAPSLLPAGDQSKGGATPAVGNGTRGGGGQPGTNGLSHKPKPPLFTTRCELSETVLLREVLYAFQGVEGKYLKSDAKRDHISIDPKVTISPSVRCTVLRLVELGWLHSRVRLFCRSVAARPDAGLLAQSLASVLREQLEQFYRLIALMEAQLSGGEMDGERLTLRRLNVWTLDPFFQMRFLASLTDACGGETGGALASVLHRHLSHGDPALVATVRHLLSKTCEPLFVMLSQWMFDGELEDRHSELFIAADPSVTDDRLWHDKYQLRDSQIPSFLTVEQARQILATGKSINFLRQVCRDDSGIRGIESLRATFDAINVEALYQEGGTGELSTTITSVYRETARHVLDTMCQKYQFLENLQAIRRYLLLGQGDFIRHLLELIEPELCKPATTLYPHNLNGILESAIRATNAQYEEADVLKRLDVMLLSVSPGDTGWDVFSLDYHTDGPIRTIFTPHCMTNYLMLFNALWRAKRMEFVLSGVWKRQTLLAKMTRSLTETSVVLHLCDVLTSQMVHFIHQLAYYITFEVVE